MKFTETEYINRVGDTRVRHGFLFLPRCAQIYNDHKVVKWEWKWLTKATWTEVYNGGECGWNIEQWLAINDKFE
jgi:hypothetical protein